MTTVGKTLVIVITCLSLVFMGFAVSVFATRKNWMNEYNTEVGKLKKAEEQKKSLENQIELLTKQISVEVERHKSERTMYTDQLKEQQNNYAELLNRHTQAREELTKAEAQLKIAVDNANDRRDEALKLRDLLKTAQDDKDKAVRRQFEVEQTHIELQGQHELVTTRLRDMTERASELQAVLESLGLKPESKEKTEAILKNPPQVEGIVLKVDPEGKFIEVSIGSDDGVRSGHRFEVYRTKPKGKYIGRIEITSEVEPDRAVGRILTQFKQGAFQEGDIVAPESLLRGRAASK